MALLVVDIVVLQLTLHLIQTALGSDEGHMIHIWQCLSEVGWQGDHMVDGKILDAPEDQLILGWCLPCLRSRRAMRFCG